ncbi:hypothetical protein CEXT_60371, partial [Caerostris extrusa]
PYRTCRNRFPMKKTRLAEPRHRSKISLPQIGNRESKVISFACFPRDKFSRIEKFVFCCCTSRSGNYRMGELSCFE